MAEEDKDKKAAAKKADKADAAPDTPAPGTGQYL